MQRHAETPCVTLTRSSHNYPKFEKLRRTARELNIPETEINTKKTHKSATLHSTTRRTQRAATQSKRALVRKHHTMHIRFGPFETRFTSGKVAPSNARLTHRVFYFERAQLFREGRLNLNDLT